MSQSYSIFAFADWYWVEWRLGSCLVTTRFNYLDIDLKCDFSFDGSRYQVSAFVKRSISAAGLEVNVQRSDCQ